MLRYRATIQRCALHCVRIALGASRLLTGSLIIEVQNDTERKYYDNLRSMHALPAGASRLLAGSLIIEVQNDTERKYYDNLRSMHELPAGASRPCGLKNFSPQDAVG